MRRKERQEAPQKIYNNPDDGAFPLRISNSTPPRVVFHLAGIRNLVIKAGAVGSGGASVSP